MTGLKRLEYRGYDSAGLAIDSCDAYNIVLVKRSGKVQVLEDAIIEGIHICFWSEDVAVLGQYFLLLIFIIYSTRRKSLWAWHSIRNPCWYRTYTLGHPWCAKRKKLPSPTIGRRAFICRRPQRYHHKLQRCERLFGIERTQFWVGNRHGDHRQIDLPFMARASRILIPWIGWTSYSAIGEHLLFERSNFQISFSYVWNWFYRRVPLLSHSNRSTSPVNVSLPDADLRF